MHMCWWSGCLGHDTRHICHICHPKPRLFFIRKPQILPGHVSDRAWACYLGMLPRHVSDRAWAYQGTLPRHVSDRAWAYQGTLPRHVSERALAPQTHTLPPLLPLGMCVPWVGASHRSCGPRWSGTSRACPRSRPSCRGTGGAAGAARRPRACRGDTHRGGGGSRGDKVAKAIRLELKAPGHPGVMLNKGGGGAACDWSWLVTLFLIYSHLGMGTTELNYTTEPRLGTVWNEIRLGCTSVHR